MTLSFDYNTVTHRTKELEAKMKWADEISNIQAARIEELSNCVAVLEAKLAKAVEDLELALDLADNGLVDFDKYCLSCDADINERYRTTLAELKGQDDE